MCVHVCVCMCLRDRRVHTLPIIFQFANCPKAADIERKKKGEDMCRDARCVCELFMCVCVCVCVCGAS